MRVADTVAYHAPLPSGTGLPGSATFWITNPGNRFVGNMAAGS